MNNGFVTRKLELASSLGERLKKIRLKANIRIEEMARVMKIQKDYLVALEEGKYDQLPADVYVRGYLKQYVSYLGLDYDEILELYKKERGIEEHIKKSKAYPEPSRRINFVITPKMIRVAGILILVLGLFFYLWMQLTSLAAPPTLEIYEPASDVTIKEGIIKIKGKTEPEIELFINDKLISIDGQGNFEESVGLTQGMNTLNVKAKSKVGKETEITRKVLVELPEVQKVAGEQDQNKPKKCTEELELIITIKDDPTWLHILEDDKIVFSQVAPVDFFKIFHAKEKITISSGKAHTTFVEFCGKDLGALGEKGEVVSGEEFTRDKLEE